MPSSRSLHVVPSPVGKQTFDNRFEVASQVLAAGHQDYVVRVLTPLSGPQRGQIGVRVGRVLVYVANREALASFTAAWAEAADLADKAFGPLMPAHAIGPPSKS